MKTKQQIAEDATREHICLVRPIFCNYGLRIIIIPLECFDYNNNYNNDPSVLPMIKRAIKMYLDVGVSQFVAAIHNGQSSSLHNAYLKSMIIS